MRRHNIAKCYSKIKEILIMPPDLAVLSTLTGSNYPCLELIFVVPKLFEPLKFDCSFTNQIEAAFASRLLSSQQAQDVVMTS